MGRQPGLGQRGLHPQSLLPPTPRTARPITDEEPGVPGRPDPARGRSAHSTENGRVCILPVTPSVSWKSSGRLQARPTAGRRSSPGPGPAPRWTARRPAPWPALAAPAGTEAVGVSAPPCPPAPPWATCRPLPTTTKLRARVAREGLVSAAPMTSVRTHTHLQCRVEDDVPPTAASARQQNPQSASPTPTRLCSPSPTPLQPKPQVPLLGPGRPSGAEAKLEARITWGCPRTLTSCTRRSALRPGCPTPSGAGGPSASGCTWGRPGVGAGGLPCPPEHLDRVEVASAITEGVRPPEGSRMRGVIPSPDGLRSACSTLGQVGGPRVWPRHEEKSGSRTMGWGLEHSGQSCSSRVLTGGRRGTETPRGC